MKYSTVLSELYSNNLSRILNVLNQSTYATNFIPNEKSYVIHTGFTFNTHKKKLMEVLYDCFSGRLIKQPRNENFSTSIPLVNGILLGKANQFFSGMLPFIIIQINEDDDEFMIGELIDPRQYFQKEYVEEVEVDGLEETCIIKFITIISDGRILKFPFQKRFFEDIFYDGDIFRRNMSFEERMYEDSSSDEFDDEY